MQPDLTLTNGRFDLPPSARGVLVAPIEHRGEPRPVPVVVRSNGPITRLFRSFFRA